MDARAGMRPLMANLRQEGLGLHLGNDEDKDGRYNQTIAIEYGTTETRRGLTTKSLGLSSFLRMSAPRWFSI